MPNAPAPGAFLASLDDDTLAEFAREATLELLRRRDAAADARRMKESATPPIHSPPKPRYPALEPEPSVVEASLRSMFPIEYFAGALSDPQLLEYASAITSELLGRGLLESHTDRLTDRQIHEYAVVITSKLLERVRDFRVTQKIILSLAERALDAAMQLSDPRFVFNLLQAAVEKLHKESRFMAVIRSAKSVPVIYSPFGFGTPLDSLKKVVGADHWQKLRASRAKSIAHSRAPFLAHKLLSEVGAIRLIAQAKPAIVQKYPQSESFFQRLPNYAEIAKTLPEFRKATWRPWFDAAWAALLESTNGQPERVREWDPILRSFGKRKGVTAEQAIKDDLRDAIERLAPA